jgi:acetoacetyl-CoA synthetase
MRTSGIYWVVEESPKVQDSLGVDLEYLGRPSLMILFVVLQEDQTIDDAMRERINAWIRTKASARHVPDKVVQIADIPRTLSGK